MVKQKVNVIGMSTSETLALSGVSKISKQQFLNYIAKVDNIEQLQYVFNKSKLSLDEAKNGMKEFFKTGDNIRDIFNANKNLFNKVEISPNNYVNSWEKLKVLCDNDNLFDNLIAKKIVTTN